ncbi:MAG: sensor histidine kinase [Planctomycetota bacterium]|nr:sensor histidine kinase [Planctomycetota bacterium]
MRINSLTTRFLLALLVCTAIPFLGFGLYVRGEVGDREQEQIVNVYLPRFADDAARKIATTLDTAVRSGWHLVKFAEFSLLTEAEAETGCGGLPQFQDLVYSLYHVNLDLDMVVLAGESGEVLSVMRSPGLDSQKEEELALLEPTNVRETAWFQSAHSNKREVSHFGRHLSPYLHRNPDQHTNDPRNYSLGVSFPVHTANGKLGALYMLLRWKTIQEVIDETRQFLRAKAGFESAEVMLTDRTGRILAHSERAQYGVLLESESLRNWLLTGDSGGRVFVTPEGEERGLGFAKTSIPGGDANEWRIGVHATTAELFEVSREFGMWLLLVVPVIAALVICLAYASSRAIIRPVRRLSEATRQVAQGNLDARVDQLGGDELSDLGRAFNTMASDLMENRERLVEAERQSAWAEMARQIAHEIKNPLTPMRMSAQLMQRARREGDERWKELADRLAQNVFEQTDALDRIAADFRQFAGSPARKVAEMRADDLLLGIQKLVASMSEATEVDMVFEAGAGDAVIDVDVQEMRRVFLNLIHNAIQACGDQGRVAISSLLVDGRVEYRIEDNGSGVPDDTRPRLFEPYFTTKTAGTGLGLAICHKIVEAHNGEIKLESSVPQRTVFLLTLPLRSE